MKCRTCSLSAALALALGIGVLVGSVWTFEQKSVQAALGAETISDPQTASSPAQPKDASLPSSRYMGGPAKLVTAPNGAIVNQEVLEQLPKTAWTKGPEIENPAKGIYVLGGYLISACIMVEAETGLIVFDTGDTKQDGEKLLKAIRTFSNKPVKAIVYGHTH